MESVKIWQTNEDYFLEPRAAATAGLAASNGGNKSPFSVKTPVTDGDGLSPGVSSAGDASTVLGYVVCSLLGGVLGGVAVGWCLGKSGTRKWSRVYESIQGRGTSTPGL